MQGGDSWGLLGNLLERPSAFSQMDIVDGYVTASDLAWADLDTALPLSPRPRVYFYPLGVGFCCRHGKHAPTPTPRPVSKP